MKRLIACVALLTVTAVLPLSAQDGPGPISWLAFDTSAPGKSRDLIGMTIKDDGPMYDQLMKDGTLLGWGIAIPINHRLDDQWNYVLWATMADWAKVGGLQAGFEKNFASQTPEQMAAMQAAYKEATVQGAHHDWIVRQRIYRQGSSDTVPHYLDLGYFKAKPGMDEAMTAFFKNQIAPINEKLLADGIITGYGMYTQELHGEPGWSHVAWTAISDLGDKDRADEVFWANFSDAQMAEAMSLMDWNAHKDQILLIVHLGAAESQK
jgi:hypothetical protein